MGFFSILYSTLSFIFLLDIGFGNLLQNSLSKCVGIPNGKNKKIKEENYSILCFFLCTVCLISFLVFTFSLTYKHDKELLEKLGCNRFSLAIFLLTSTFLGFLEYDLSKGL